MRATTYGVSAPADSSDKAIVGASAPCISSHSAARRHKAEGVRDILGHVIIDVTQNVYGWLAITRHPPVFNFQFLAISAIFGNLLPQLHQVRRNCVLGT
jgi:hypothetical protein